MSPLKSLVILLIVALPASSSEGLRPHLVPVAKKVASLLADLEQREVALGAFPCENPGASAGPGIAVVLAEELEKLQLRVRAGAGYRVQGSYKMGERNARGHLSALVLVEIIDPAGKGRGSFEEPVQFSTPLPGPRRPPAGGDIDGTGVLGVLMPVTVELPPNKGMVDRHKEFEAALKRPPFLDGSRVRASAKCPVAVEVLVDDRPLTPVIEKARAFVPLKRDTTYCVRLINDSDMDVAVTLHIDGLSVFDFSETPGLNHYLVPSKATAVVRGWYVTPERADSFRVTEYAKSAVAQRLKDDSQVGTITASFAAAWEKNKEPPAEELAARLTWNRGDDVGTSRGPSVAQKLKVVERHVGVVRALISVQYSKK
jgi:hypothetical protein